MFPNIQAFQDDEPNQAHAEPHSHNDPTCLADPVPEASCPPPEDPTWPSKYTRVPEPNTEPPAPPLGVKSAEPQPVKEKVCEDRRAERSSASANASSAGGASKDEDRRSTD